MTPLFQTTQHAVGPVGCGSGQSEPTTTAAIHWLMTKPRTPGHGAS